MTGNTVGGITSIAHSHVVFFNIFCYVLILRVRGSYRTVQRLGRGITLQSGTSKSCGSTCTARIVDLPESEQTFD